MTLISDCAYWIWCRLAFWFVLVLPSHRGGWNERLWLWLLPSAGFYAYRDPSWMSWRRSAAGGGDG